MILSIFALFLNAQAMPKVQTKEMQRIAVIVNDINKLRRENIECNEKLKEQTPQDIISTENITQLNKRIQEQQGLLKLKDSIIKNLRDLLNKPKKLKKDDGFPTLVMKEKYQKKSDEKAVVKFKASNFVLIVDSIIYDAIDGKRVNKWNKKTSFTSGVKTKKWIKVSGYFVDKKWTKAKREMWIKIAQVSKK